MPHGLVQAWDAWSCRELRIGPLPHPKVGLPLCSLGLGEQLMLLRAWEARSSSSRELRVGPLLVTSKGTPLSGKQQLLQLLAGLGC